MKQYLWTGIMVLLMSANASENPFELKENFGKLDNDEASILGQLKKVAERQELAEDATLDDALEDEEEVISPSKEVDKVSTDVNEKKTETVENTSVDSIRQKAMEAAKKEHLEKEILLKKVEEKEAELKSAKAEEAKLAQAQEEAEKREVEAYEKKRVAKLAEEAKISAALEKVALAQKEEKLKAKKLKKEKALLVQKEKEKEKEATANLAKKKLLEVSKTEEKAKQEKVKIEKVAKKEEKIKVKNIVPHPITSVDDINVTREANEAKLAADKLYEEAVKEMSRED